MKTTSLKLSALASALLLAGCGGGSSTADTAITDTATTTTNSLSKISGTVPGTLIEAFCEDGSYYSVKSTENNTDEHPFEIEIPSTLSCSLVMTTNEDDNVNKVVTQIGIITPDANGTLFTAASDVDLGHIPLAMDPSNINDINGDHVSDDVLNIQVDGTAIKIELENPLDDDNDGLVNVYEDDDNDGISNHDDDDDDGDGEVDIDNDLDDDGIDNEEDVDDDNDGYHDDEDSDDDNDGIDDYLDSDDDNDGIDDDDEDPNIPLRYRLKCIRCAGDFYVSLCAVSWYEWYLLN